MHAAMLQSRNSTRKSETSQMRGYEAGDLVYARDSRPNRRWTVAMVSKYHYSLVYEVEVEKEKQMVAIPQPAETNIFIDFWSPNLYPVIHTDR